jgi:hypothetical protein
LANADGVYKACDIAVAIFWHLLNCASPLQEKTLHALFPSMS